jgi:mono/diheme cytochrome c family protein
MPTATTTAHGLRQDEDGRKLAQVFSAYIFSATLWLLFSTAVGLLVSFKFAYPDFATAPALSFGRLRAIHTNGTFYAWASPALVGLALYIAARSSGTKLYSVRLAWISLALLNLAAIIGTITLDLGYNYGQEYREWLWWIRIILALGLITTDHERTSWGNHGALITSAEVVTVKANEPMQNGPKGTSVVAAPPPLPAQAATLSFDARAGSSLFQQNCAACHGADGKGISGAFPALVSDPVVTANDPNDHILTVLHGLKGEKIGGVSYDSEMPSFAGQLSDQDIANIIDHERSSRGNKTSLVTPKDVGTLRGKK